MEKLSNIFFLGARTNKPGLQETLYWIFENGTILCLAHGFQKYLQQGGTYNSIKNGRKTLDIDWSHASQCSLAPGARQQTGKVLPDILNFLENPAIAFRHYTHYQCEVHSFKIDGAMFLSMTSGLCKNQILLVAVIKRYWEKRNMEEEMRTLGFSWIPWFEKLCRAQEAHPPQVNKQGHVGMK